MRLAECLLQTFQCNFGPFPVHILARLSFELTSAIKITIDNTLPLPNSHQHSLRTDALGGIKPVIHYFKRGFIIPCRSPCNSPILLVKKLNGKEWRFVQDLIAINKDIPWSQIHLPYYLSAIPADCQYFSVIDLCGAFLSISVKDKRKTGNPSLSVLGLWGYMESPTYFSQTLNTN